MPSERANTRAGEEERTSGRRKEGEENERISKR